MLDVRGKWMDGRGENEEGSTFLCEEYT